MRERKPSSSSAAATTSAHPVVIEGVNHTWRSVYSRFRNRTGITKKWNGGKKRTWLLALWVLSGIDHLPGWRGTRLSRQNGTRDRRRFQSVFLPPAISREAGRRGRRPTAFRPTGRSPRRVRAGDP